ncbi:MAG: extracellular solute-binding protein [Caldilinea sp.]|uniref:ABC transporter substrate-binding protein n=1 Tax=Caldilinea sp. TaxID=2293560 RepID=UPI002BA653B2|nr:extracellular solute-binding protein [Anaerolineales bacterium]HQY92617.1 extracellular solute-binding protein [Caldilinea sp.]HRA64786.1 extracellular solute-binding protein [Caldilinea sp.]
MSRYRQVLSVLALLSFLLMLSACTAPTTLSEPASSSSDATVPVVTWYYYDQDNTDPEANERVGNFYLAETIPQFDEEFAGQYRWVNVPRDYNLVLDLVAAVQNNGDVPDIMRTGTADIPTFLLNNTVQDITDYVTSAPWYADLDPKAVEACTGPDGKIYCVPVSESPYLVYFWTDLYPEGFPKTTDAFLAQADELKADENFALTYWGSTAFDGEGAGRYYYQVISSFGGSYDDGQGNMRLNTPENVAAVEFMREIVANGYSPEAAFVGNFEEEASFKDGLAGAFPTGFYIGYQYLNPLKSPTGQEFNTISAQDMEDAVNAGVMGLAPIFAPEGATPGCHMDVFGFVIPTGAKNVEGAKAYIDWIMQQERAVQWVLRAGGGVPVASSVREDAAFQTEIFKQGAAALEASDCKPWYGSLTRIAEAKKLITETMFDLLKGNPDADIAAALAATEAEYNSNN